MNAPNLPSQWADEVLSGRVRLEDAPGSVRSWLRLFIYTQAVKVVKLSGKDERLAAIASLVDSLRAPVEAEVRRLWVWRGEL